MVLNSSWKPVYPRSSILGPALFNIFINEQDDEAECTFSKFASDTPLGGVVDMLEVRLLARGTLIIWRAGVKEHQVQ